MRLALALLSGLLLTACGDDGDSGSSDPGPPPGPLDRYASDDPAFHECDTAADCDEGDLCLVGVCLSAGDLPGGDASRGGERRDENGVNVGIDQGIPPVASCWKRPDVVPDEPAEVELRGRVDALGSGGNPQGLCVTVYERDALLRHWREDSRCMDVADPLPRSACFGTSACDCAGLAGPDLTRCEADAGPWIGDTIVRGSDGRFEIRAVPTNVPLVVKVTGERDGAGEPRSWIDTYVWDTVARTDRLDTDDNGEVSFRAYASVVSKVDWVTFPPVLGLTRGVTPGNGVVAGELLDCGSDSRDPEPIIGAVLGSIRPAEVLGFHNGDPEAAIGFEIELKATANLGIYGALNIPAGANRLAAVARIFGELELVAISDFFMPPGSAVLLNFQGRSLQRGETADAAGAADE